jgi:hypothetical protein
LTLGRFKVRRGEIELEYEGEDSSDKYELAVGWIKSLGSSTSTHPVENRPNSETESSIDEGKSEQKGRMKKGRGQAAIAKAKIMEVLVPGGYLDAPKSNEEITGELSRRGWPIPGKRVSDALFHLVKDGKVDRFGTSGSYKYSRPTSKEKTR